MSESRKGAPFTVTFEKSIAPNPGSGASLRAVPPNDETPILGSSQVVGSEGDRVAVDPVVWSSITRVDSDSEHCMDNVTVSPPPIEKGGSVCSSEVVSTTSNVGTSS